MAENRPDMSDAELSPSEFFVEFVAWIRRHQTLVLINLLLALAVAIVYPFFIAKPQYVSKLTFLPPASDGGGSLGLLGALSGQALSSSSQDITDDQVQTIFNGETFARGIIDKLNLIRRYKVEKQINPYQRSVRTLHKKLSLEEESSAGLGYNSIISFTISAEDRNADTALLMANTAFAQLDSAVREISVSRARTRRSYLEKLIAERRRELDSAQTVLTAFQKKNKLVDAGTQARASLDVSGEIQASIYKLDAQIEMMQATEGSQGAQVSMLRAQRQSLQNRLRSLESRQSSGLLPGLMQSLDMGPQYERLSREVSARASVLVFLTQQEESERIAEEKTISRLNVVDQAWKPEYKSKPKRIPMALAIFLGENLFFLGTAAFRFYFKKRVAGLPLWLSFCDALKRPSDVH